MNLIRPRYMDLPPNYMIQPIAKRTLILFQRYRRFEKLLEMTPLEEDAAISCLLDEQADCLELLGQVENHPAWKSYWTPTLKRLLAKDLTTITCADIHSVKSLLLFDFFQ